MLSTWASTQEFDAFLGAIDFERDDPDAPELAGMAMSFQNPVTEQLIRYPETTMLTLDPGRVPTWLRPYMGLFRRLYDSAHHGSLHGFLGFHELEEDRCRGREVPVGTFSCHYKAIGWRTLVTRDVGRDPGLMGRIRASAVAAGWQVTDTYGLPGFSAFR